MAKAKKHAPRKVAGRSRSTPADAIALLKADHRQVEEWFAQFEAARSDERKQKLAQQCCQALQFCDDKSISSDIEGVTTVMQSCKAAGTYTYY